MKTPSETTSIDMFHYKYSKHHTCSHVWNSKRTTTLEHGPGSSKGRHQPLVRPVRMRRLVHRGSKRRKRRRPDWPLAHNTVPVKVSFAILHHELFTVFRRTRTVRFLVRVQVLHVHYRVLLVGIVLFVGRMVSLRASRRSNWRILRGIRPGRPGVRQEGSDAKADVPILGSRLLLGAVGLVADPLHGFTVLSVQVVYVLDSHNLNTLSLFLQHQDRTWFGNQPITESLDDGTSWWSLFRETFLIITQLKQPACGR